MTPAVRRALEVSAPVHIAFGAFTDQLGAWWPLPSHGVFGDRAGGVAFEDGRLVERATNGDASVWGEVVAWESPDRIAVTWHPGQGAEDASEIEVRFLPTDGGTRVELEHRGWDSGSADAPARRRGYVGPGTWGAVLEHYADLVEPRTGRADLSALIAAYQGFWAEAERGGFGEPPAGEWDADQVIAHVSLNDAAMTAVAHAILDGRQPTFANDECSDLATLAAYAARFASRQAMIANGQRLSATAVAALGRLDDEQRAAPVHCRLLHYGKVVLDEPRPWASIADQAQHGIHLPAHLGQLQDLR